MVVQYVLLLYIREIEAIQGCQQSLVLEEFLMVSLIHHSKIACLDGWVESSSQQN
jgi:hypothetical protein